MHSVSVYHVHREHGFGRISRRQACSLCQLNEVGFVVDVVHIDHPHTDEAAWGTDRMMHRYIINIELNTQH